MDDNEEKTIDIDKRVGQFIQLRDEIQRLDDEHKKKMAPFREALSDLNALLLSHLNQIGGDNVKSAAGTVYRKTRTSASLADKSAFWSYVVTQGMFELIDYKANAPAVVQHAEDHGTLPPGVNLNSRQEVGVRRS